MNLGKKAKSYGTGIEEAINELAEEEDDSWEERRLKAKKDRMD